LSRPPRSFSRIEVFLGVFMVPSRQGLRSSKSPAGRSIIARSRLICAVEDLEQRRLLSGAAFSPATPPTAISINIGTSFLPSTDYPVGGGSTAVVTGDFNGDGNQDILTANYNGTLNLLLGNGDGTFAPAETFSDGLGSVYGGHVSMAAGDFNGDGNLDIAVAQETGTVSILLGNGDGTFQSPTTLTFSGNVDAVAAADLNGDGNDDLVVGLTSGIGGSTATIDALLSNGDGTFQSPTAVYGGVFEGTIQIAPADFNNDGNVDLAVSTGQFNAASILLGNGDGTFQAPLALPQTGAVEQFAMADLNNDGVPDLIENVYQGGVNQYHGAQVLLGKGDGTFSTGQFISGYDSSIIAADMNGDGNADLVVVHGGGVSILLNNGDGTFSLSLSFPGAGVSRYATAGVVADFNGDGLPDIVTAGQNAPDTVVINDTDQAVPVVDPGPIVPIVLFGSAGLGSSAPASGFKIGAEGRVVVTGTNGADTLNLSVSGSDLNVTLNGISDQVPLAEVTGITLKMRAGDDSVTIQEGVPAVLCKGGAGNDTIEASNTAADTLRGGQGRDSLSGGIGIFDGGPGADTITGFSGEFFGDGGNDSITGSHYIDGGNGSDTLLASLGGGTVIGGAGNDSLGEFFTVGVNGITSTPAIGSVSFHGGAGNDTITASPNAGADTLIGGSGDDSLTGNNGSNDLLIGGTGADTLIGSLGASGTDTLIGGGGHDSVDPGSRDLVIN
jgi:Ca2+-binding RTX toxin-like protein